MSEYSRILNLANSCHNESDGKFCSDGKALVEVGIDLRDLSKHFPERLGHLQRIVELISTVHGMPEGFADAKVEVWSNLAGAKGAYVVGDNLIKLDEDSPEYAASVLCHEYGHHLTLSERGEGKVEFYQLLSKDPELKAWHNAVKATPQFAKMAKTEGDIGEFADTRDHASYLKDPRELFARSYSQWIATKTGDAVLLKQHQMMRDETKGLYQWSSEEFEPIGKAMDAWFEKRGWLR